MVLVKRYAIVEDGRVTNVVVSREGYVPESGTAIPLSSSDPVSPGDYYAEGSWTPDPERLKRQAERAAASRVEAEAARQREEARGKVIAALRDLRDGTGDLNTRNLTAALRLIARELLASQGEEP